MTMLQANAVFKYGQGIANPDGTVTLHLTLAMPADGSGLRLDDFVVPLTAANITAINGAGTQAQKKTALDGIVTTYLKAQYRPTTTIDASLALLVGQTVTVA